MTKIMKFKDWLTYEFPQNELIIGGSAIDGSDSWQTHPIGFSARISPFLPQQIIASNNKLCLACWSSHTRKSRLIRQKEILNKEYITEYNTSHKKSIWEHIILKKDKKDKMLSPTAYIEKMLCHKFVLSPRGNGIDTHRTYEAIICKGIPIVDVDTHDMREKYAKLPVIFCNNFDIKEDYLHSLYAQMLETEYDFDRLTLTYWRKHSPVIDDNSNFWKRKIWGDTSPSHFCS